MASDPAVEDCGTGHDVRFKDTNGLAEMKRSQVTHVPLVFGTFKRALSPHRTCVAPVLSVTRRRLVQQHVAGVCQWIEILCRACCFGTPAVCDRIGALHLEDFRLHAACTS